MPVKIRLQRHGKKGKPFYWIVAADSRAKRDGKFLEKLGTYNPNTDPAQINLNLDNSVTWLRNGAQPTETARRILSYKGVMIKHHLLKGVDKGALTEAQAEEKFQAWLRGKEEKIEGKKENLDKAKADAKAKTMKAEREISEKRKAVVEIAEESEKAEKAAEAENVVVEEAKIAPGDAKETPAEEVKEVAEKKTEEPQPPAAEAVVAEEKTAEAETAVEEAPKADKEVAAEATAEKPAEENKAEESKEDKAADA